MEKQNRSTIPVNWVQNCFVVFFTLLPFVYSAKGVDPVLLPRQLFVSLLVLLFSGFLLFRLKRGMVVQSVIPLCLVIWMLGYWISTLQAVNVTESQYIALKITLFVSFFLLMYVGFTQQLLTIKMISKGIAFSGVIAAALAIRDMLFLLSQGVHLFEGDNMYKVNATFGHKNLLSSYLFICLPMLAAQFVYATKRLHKVLVCIALILILTVVATLQTRAVLLALCICSTVGFILFVRNKRLSEKHRKTGMLVLLVLLCLGLTAGYLWRAKLAYITRTESFIERKHVWENTWQMISRDPLTGVGAANWQIHFPQYGIQKFYDVNYTITEGLTNFQRPHNDFLWIWAETGLVGFSMYTLVFLLSCMCAYRLYKKEQNDKSQLLYALILVQLIGFVFISLVDFPLERIEHPLVILTTIAFVAAVSPNVYVSIKLSKWSLMLLLIAALYSLFICDKRRQSELQLKKMYKAHITGDWGKLVTEGKKIQTVYLNMDYYSIPVSWYIGVGYFMQNNLSQARQYFEKAYLLHPYQVHVLNNYGACYEKEGNSKKAIELLEAANKISPSFSDGIINLSGTYYNAGRYDDAFNMICTIGYDDNNPRLKTFVLTIVKKKISLLLAGKPEPMHATFLQDLLSDDEAILKCFKESKEKHFVLADYLMKDAIRN